METEQKTVVDKRKLTDAEIGKVFKKTEEIIRRIEERTILYEDVIELLQKIVIEKKTEEHKLYLGTVRNTHQIKKIEHTVDCDKAPFIPCIDEGWTLKEHQKSGIFEFRTSKLSLFKIKNEPESMDEFNIRVKLGLFLNANVLDYLLMYPYLIPDKWLNESHIIFKGTKYYEPKNGYAFRGLTRDNIKGKWIWAWFPTNFLFGCLMATTE